VRGAVLTVKFRVECRFRDCTKGISAAKDSPVHMLFASHTSIAACLCEALSTLLQYPLRSRSMKLYGCSNLVAESVPGMV